MSRIQSAENFIRYYEVENQLLMEFLQTASKQGLTLTNNIRRVSDELRLRLKAQMAKNLFDEDTMYHVLLKGDQDFEKAMEVLDNYTEFAVIKK
jgi:hypothetical protein